MAGESDRDRAFLSLCPSEPDILDRRMRQARVLAMIGIASIVCLVGITALIVPDAGGDGAGLLVVVLAGLAFPFAGVAFGAAFTLTASVLLMGRENATRMNLVVGASSAVGTIVFGFFVFALFFGKALIP